MLQRLDKNFSIQPIVDQTLGLNFESRLSLNYTDGYLFSGPYHTRPEFLNTPLGNLLQNLGPIGEARLMRLKPEQTYMAHADPDDRIQLTIVTNPYSYLIDLDENKMYHLPVDGELWSMDTSRKHTAANFGSRDRIHLNIRCLLPDIDQNYFHYQIINGDFDDRHVIQSNISPFLNKEIKSKNILGIRKVNDRELLIQFKNKNIKDRFEHLIINSGLNFNIL